MTAAAVAIACALQLLGRPAHSLPPIEILEHRPLDVSVNAEAFVRRSASTISIIASAPAFADALRAADDRPRCNDREAFAVLASVIAHEEWHVLNGHDESGAYAAQLMVLRSLGYEQGSGPFSRVWQSMMNVRKRVKSSRPAD